MKQEIQDEENHINHNNLRNGGNMVVTKINSNMQSETDQNNSNIEHLLETPQFSNENVRNTPPQSNIKCETLSILSDEEHMEDSQYNSVSTVQLTRFM